MRAHKFQRHLNAINIQATRPVYQNCASIIDALSTATRERHRMPLCQDCPAPRVIPSPLKRLRSAIEVPGEKLDQIRKFPADSLPRSLTIS
jgi:hypothetical protein